MPSGVLTGALTPPSPVRSRLRVRSPPSCLQETPPLLPAAARFYAGQLRRNTEGQEYLPLRGVGQVAAARLGLGYSPGNGLRRALESCGFSDRRIQDSGLFMERGVERFAGWWSFPTSSGFSSGGSSAEP